MTEKRKPRANAPPIVEAHFVSDSGIPRIVLVPEGETDLARGIPVSFDISPLYPHMPDTFLSELTSALHAVGLIKAVDYFKPEAGAQFRAAMLSVIKHDFSNAQALAKEELNIPG